MIEESVLAVFGPIPMSLRLTLFVKLDSQY